MQRYSRERERDYVSLLSFAVQYTLAYTARGFVSFTFSLGPIPSFVNPSPFIMRLLHTTELRFQEFFNRDIPYYAVLSHRWEEDEVSFQEMQFLLLSPEDRARVLTPALLNAETKVRGKGYKKVLDFCKFAAFRCHTWVWIDTVCIDKASSAELSEAINSMWGYYRDSERCNAYLSDVLASANTLQEILFGSSEWFKRGWTLQELIAPKEVDFLDSEWNYIGNKSTHGPVIEEICGIPRSCLSGRQYMGSFTVAMRMSWARNRETSRREDVAYCLMGLFSVHMPLLYGEGDRAFARLCEEILKTSNDDSIFLHPGPALLPRSPSDFRPSSHYSSLSYGASIPELETNYVVTKGFLNVQHARIEKYPVLDEERLEGLTLNCFRGSRGIHPPSRPTLPIQKTFGIHNVYRVHHSREGYYPLSAVPRELVDFEEGLYFPALPRGRTSSLYLAL